MTSLFSRFRPALFAGSALFLAAVTLCGQSASSLRGTVVDPQGAVIPEVVIALVNNGTGSSRQTLTDATGVYQFLQMAPGEYTLTATKVGFDTLTESHVKLLAVSYTHLQERSQAIRGNPGASDRQIHGGGMARQRKAENESG